MADVISSNYRKGFVMHCSYCGSKYHEIEYCPKTWGGQANRNALKCSYCGSNNHNRAACPKAWPTSDKPVKLKD